jgi:hypothetical protein
MTNQRLQWPKTKISAFFLDSPCTLQLQSQSCAFLRRQCKRILRKTTEILVWNWRKDLKKNTLIFFFGAAEKTASRLVFIQRYIWRHDTQHEDAQLNDNTHNATQHNCLNCDTRHKHLVVPYSQHLRLVFIQRYIWRNDNQHKDAQLNDNTHNATRHSGLHCDTRHKHLVVPYLQHSRIVFIQRYIWHHDTQHEDAQLNDNTHNATQHNCLYCDTQHKHLVVPYWQHLRLVFIQKIYLTPWHSARRRTAEWQYA